MAKLIQTIADACGSTAARVKEYMDGIRDDVNGDLNDLDKRKPDFNKVYPVGAIYLTLVDHSPADLFGGKWARIKDVFLLAAGDKYAAGTGGGEAEHVLTVNEMPEHTHAFNMSFGGLTMFEPAASGSPVQSAVATSSSTGNIAETGGGQAHNNMPPYLTVYMWQRIA